MTTTQQLGRRERNKREKLQRITDAARELFDAHGIDNVSTQQIAERADVASGTLFLYARTKAELLLLVQNSAYRVAQQQGRREAADAPTAVGAILALVRPIVVCNREHPANGRAYWREMLFGDPTEPNHAEALELVAVTEHAVAEALTRTMGLEDATAAPLSHVMSSAVYVTLAGATDSSVTADELCAQIATLLASIVDTRRHLVTSTTPGRAQ